MNRRARAQIFFQKKSKLFLNTAPNSNDDVRGRMIVDLGKKRVIANLRSVARSDVKIGGRSQTNRAQPRDCFFVRVFTWNNPEHALVGMRCKSRDQALEKFES